MGVMKEKLFIYEFDSVDDEMIKRTEVEGSQNDLEPIYFDGRSCLIDCNQNINSQVKKYFDGMEIVKLSILIKLLLVCLFV